jgi:hypothetical protein
VIAGEDTSVTGQVMFASIDEAEHANGTAYFVYLVQDFDISTVDLGRPEPYDWIELGDLPRFEVGTIRFGARDANLVRVRATITVPTTLQPGTYTLMACDEGCERPLADVMASPIRVWADAESAKVANQLYELRALLSQRRAALYQARRETSRAEASVTTLEAEVSALEGQVETLQAQLSDMAAVLSTPAPAPEPRSDGAGWLMLALWFLAGVGMGAVVVALVVRRRRRLAEPPVDAWRDADRAMRGGSG